ncbi:hypothetical protein JJJ17_06400 [Paracoccus caeni]|uniref:Uncharacterized protein n=1 Tax=Paracoccus caeni TaxID=657651 RepID=A0A934VY22_9RHOB|nr:hypothetical protein [Paracoccus caeni]MBK4215552.1 hypothetical protein [Paracoccus caeni]
MQSDDAYSDRQRVWAVNLSALLGWAIISTPVVIGLGIGILPFAAIIGLPVAFTVCWTAVAPLLWYVTRKNVTWRRALGWGIVTATMLTLAFIALTRFMGWLEYMDPSRSSQIGGGDQVVSVDGILTPYGWLQLAKNSTIFILVATCAALIIRWIIGPGKHLPCEDMTSDQQSR